MGPLEQQSIHQLLPLTRLHSRQQGQHLLHITAAIGRAEALLAAVAS